ncbi:4Fe-4S single cluster domain-containing protein [Gordonia crocea]|uniref:4Fe-4S single cluster domain-containing protein n=1 Tax=Gordonia crocea TaxID=589162 RepID=UPI001E4D11BA|nr:4Fe-4S single cluster domain-containing protein [Gordonia crocea]
MSSTVAEGPGTRFALWVQGCSLQCPGCFNPHLWGTKGGTDRRVADLVDDVSAADVDGITLLGGEPFEQAVALAALADAVRARGLSVMTFTGYDLPELTGAGAPTGSAELLAATDLLVTGRYERERPDHRRPWVGSTNQRFEFLTDRYRHLEQKLRAIGDRLEIRVDATGAVMVNGWSSMESLEMLLDDPALILRRPGRNSR